VGFNAQQVRQGICQRGATKRQGERVPGPICLDTLAKNIVKRNLRDLEIVFNGAIQALAKAGVSGAKVTGIADGADLETTEPYAGCGQVTRKVRIEETRGKVHEIKVDVFRQHLWHRQVVPMMRDGHRRQAQPPIAASRDAAGSQPWRPLADAYASTRHAASKWRKTRMARSEPLSSCCTYC
jgi:hypothetical protein